MLATEYGPFFDFQAPCTVASYDFFSENTCTTTLSPVMVGGSQGIYKAAATVGGHYPLEIARLASGVPTTSVWIKATETGGLISLCKEVQIQVCGFETVSVVNATV